MNQRLIGCLVAMLFCRPAFCADTFEYKIGHLGNPASSILYEMTVTVPWTEQTLGQLKTLGFNTIQLNVAWGPRPNDEPLNIEDVVQLTPEQEKLSPQVVPLRSRPGPEAREKRRADLKHRIELCKKLGFRTLFHFGAPFNAHATYGDGPPNCVSDDKMIRRYEMLIETFAREFPGIDDLLIYTYDQDAWLCSEFGPCPRCLGVPLDERVATFLTRLKSAWRKSVPQGRLWWEPWELSAGQVLKTTQHIEPDGFGLMLHCTIAEVIGTMPVDRWLKNNAALAKQRGIPVVVEYWLSSPSEEVETYTHLPYPLMTLRGLKAIAAVPGVVGIKEYYGLNPTVEDPSLRTTGMFFQNPGISEDEALEKLAASYGPAAKDVKEYWRLTTEGMELFPWDTTWLIREPGRSRTDHSLSAATLRGLVVHTPSWVSNRKAAFMRTEHNEPDAWMKEDVQLRCELAAERWAKALELGKSIQGSVPQELSKDFSKSLSDLAGMRRRAVTYASHLRATNIATSLRKAAEMKLPRPQKLVDELGAILKDDLANHLAEIGKDKDWPEMREAIALYEKDLDKFLEQYLKEGPDGMSKGLWSITSR